MYYGSKYCDSCKYNRTCFSRNANLYDLIYDKSDCIIMEKIFEKEFNKEN